MNTKIIPNPLIIAAMLLIPWTGTALAQTDEQIEQFNKEREAYFNENLELTSAETKAFWPVYNDFHCRKARIVEDEKNTFKYSHDNSDNLSDKEINQNLDKIRQLKSELFQLEEEYYHVKFPEVLPPKKVLKLYKVEWDFRGYLIRKIRGHGQSGPGDRGTGRSSQGPRQDSPGSDPEPMFPPPAF